jgi:uncharacterized protein (DUF302 family)
MTTLGLNVALKTSFEDAITQVTAALKAEGFGILTEIDIQTTFKNKLDVDFRPYKILGACNPGLAHQALSQTADAGLLLPCNVTVSQTDDDTVTVSIVDPIAMLNVADDALRPVGEDARARLERVVAALHEDA